MSVATDWSSNSGERKKELVRRKNSFSNINDLMCKSDEVRPLKLCKNENLCIGVFVCVSDVKI